MADPAAGCGAAGGGPRNGRREIPRGLSARDGRRAGDRGARGRLLQEGGPGLRAHRIQVGHRPDQGDRGRPIGYWRAGLHQRGGLGLQGRGPERRGRCAAGLSLADRAR
ncbi:hypothetical protein G6F68_012954 [Rhizopus microsporus]|nr:hypothetical protein G6F68_012954 [Rhizopus microsporus]